MASLIYCIMSNQFGASEITPMSWVIHFRLSTTLSDRFSALEQNTPKFLVFISKLFIFCAPSPRFTMKSYPLVYLIAQIAQIGAGVPSTLLSENHFAKSFSDIPFPFQEEWRNWSSRQDQPQQKTSWPSQHRIGEAIPTHTPPRGCRQQARQAFYPTPLGRLP